MAVKNYQLKLATRVEELCSIGPTYQKRLNRLGVFNVRDLLLYFPAKYDDLSSVKPLIEAKVGESATFKGKILNITSRRAKNRRMIITEAIVSDDTSTLKVIFFNQPFLSRLIKVGDNLVLAGKIDYKPYLGKYLANPSFEKSNNPLSSHLGRIVPIYSETKGLSSRWLRSRIKPLLKYALDFKDFLPPEIKEKLDLINLDEAIRQIHFPDFNQSLQIAIRRMAFDELFLIALAAKITKHKFHSAQAEIIRFKKSKIASFIKSLPFNLTNCQKKAAWEIICDLGKNKPMNRLLNGDVGSGKTIVAIIAAYLVSLNKKQTAIMAPTEVLALQHYQNFVKLFKNYNLKIELLTGGYHLTNKSPEYLKSDIIIGTHALIQEKVRFKNLALAVIDEQHRFGVRQRAEIKKKNRGITIPHLLSMTATPIPRTLSLALYGDLDISTLDKLPQGRQKIKTSLIPPSGRSKAYGFIRQEIKKGRQAFVICPLISAQSRPASGGEKMIFDFDSKKAAIEEYGKLKKLIFPDLRIGLLHGKMKSTDKEKVMGDFQNKQLDILVSTSVIEVGVDIPNATVMMIEGAERFGLSQLHQFRGRVGRAEHQSYCFLFTDSWQEDTKTRLKVITETNNGFKIAEADLKLRGPGEIYGQKQHGAANLRYASLFDLEMINSARREAEALVKTDPSLKSHSHLLKKLARLEKEAHLE